MSADFAQLIRQAIESGQWDERKLAQEFGCSVPTIRRWILGTGAPHPAMRVPVIRKLYGEDVAQAFKVHQS